MVCLNLEKFKIIFGARQTDKKTGDHSYTSPFYETLAFGKLFRDAIAGTCKLPEFII
jgi:hypothetical protein